MTKEWAGGFTAAASMVLNNSNAFGTTHVTGSTTITSLTPWPLVLGNEYSDAYITLVFDTVGGGVGTGGNPYPFKQAFTAATAGTAATFMWDSTSQAWFLIGSGNASDASDASGAAAAAQAAAIAASAQKSANLSDLASLPTALANLLGQPAAGTYSIVCATSTSCAPVTASTGGSSGVGPVVGASRSVTGGTSVANTTFLTVPTTGSYLISGYAWMTTASTSTGTLKVNLTYSNGSGTIFVGSNAGNMNNLASPVAFSSVVHLVAGSTVSYSTTVAASPDGAPVYSVAATATYIGPF